MDTNTKTAKAEGILENKLKGKILFPKKLAKAKAILKGVSIPAILKA